MGTHPTHKNKPNSTPVKMMRIAYHGPNSFPELKFSKLIYKSD